MSSPQLRPVRTLVRDGLRFEVLTLLGRHNFVDVFRIADGIRVDQFSLGNDTVEVTSEMLSVAASAWVSERVGAQVPEPVRCQACDTELVPALGTDTNYQFDGALWVRFSGGYAMFVDPVAEPDREALEVVLCRRCAQQLCDVVPWVAELLEPLSSHGGGAEESSGAVHRTSAHPGPAVT